MEKPKTSIVWKTSDRREKRSEIWDSWVLVEYILHTFDIVTPKVILGSFGAFAIFRNLAQILRDRREHFDWLLEQNGER